MCLYEFLKAGLTVLFVAGWLVLHILSNCRMKELQISKLPRNEFDKSPQIAQQLIYFFARKAETVNLLGTAIQFLIDPSHSRPIKKSSKISISMEIADVLIDRLKQENERALYKLKSKGKLNRMNFPPESDQLKAEQSERQMLQFTVIILTATESRMQIAELFVLKSKQDRAETKPIFMSNPFRRKIDPF